MASAEVDSCISSTGGITASLGEREGEGGRGMERDGERGREGGREGGREDVWRDRESVCVLKKESESREREE